MHWLNWHGGAYRSSSFPWKKHRRYMIIIGLKTTKRMKRRLLWALNNDKGR